MIPNPILRSNLQETLHRHIQEGHVNKSHERGIGYMALHHFRSVIYFLFCHKIRVFLFFHWCPSESIFKYLLEIGKCIGQVYNLIIFMGCKFKPELSFLHDIILILPHSSKEIARFTYPQYSWNINALDLSSAVFLRFVGKAMWILIGSHYVGDMKIFYHFMLFGRVYSCFAVILSKIAFGNINAK